MTRPVWTHLACGMVAALSLNFAAAAPAANVMYSFDGTLSDHFEPIPGIDPLVQAGGQLSYDNGGVAGPDNTEGLVSTSFVPTFDQSWTASIVGTVPASYTGVTDEPDPLDADYLQVGLVALFGGLGGELFSGGLEVNESGRGYASDAGINDYVFQPTADVTSTMTLSFDGNTKVLSFTAGGSTIAWVDTQAVWGMSTGDVFQIGVFGTSENEAVADPLILDDFIGTLALTSVPEPSTLVCVVWSMVGLASVRRRRA